MDGFVDATEVLRSGVYLLCAKGTVMYVGKAKQLCTRIYTHRQAWARKRRGLENAPWLRAKAIPFDQVLIRPCAEKEMDALERALIAEYRPRYNEQLVPRIKHKFAVRVLDSDLIFNGGLGAEPRVVIERRL